MINSDTRAAIANAVAALTNASLLPSNIRADALPGALICTHAGLNGLTPEEVEAELMHVATSGPIMVGNRAMRGYVRTALTAALGEQVIYVTLSDSDPEDEETNVPIDTIDILLVFNAPITIGNGTFQLWLDDTDDQLVQTWNGWELSVEDGDSIRLELAAPLAYESTYYVTWTDGAVRHLGGTPIAAVSDNSVLSFTTVAE